VLDRGTQTLQGESEMSEAPFAFGMSPFRAKGNVWLNFVDYVNARVAGGMEAFVAAVPGVELRGFMQQQFLRASWYDVLPFIDASRVLAQVLGLSETESNEHRGTWMAEHDLRGVHRLLLKFVSPEAALERTPNIHRQMFNFGHIEVSRLRPCYYQIQLTGFLAPHMGIWKTTTAAYLQRVLLECGAKEPSVTSGPEEPDGSRAGMPMVRAVAEAAWSR
jgi:hypothetical protein